MALTRYGPHQKKTYGARDFGVFDLGAGLDRSSAPQESAEESLTLATNVYLRTDGGVEMRRGVAKHGASFSAAPTLGTIRFYQNVVNGVPQSPTRKFLLAQSGGSLYNVDTSANLGSIGVGGLPCSVEQVEDPNHPGGTSTVLVICTGVGGPYIFDGTTIYTPANWTANIAGARWVKLVNGVLWFSGMQANPTLVWGSALGSPETVPFYNIINVSQKVMGLGAIGAGAQSAVVAGMNRGLGVISGVGPSNFNLQEVPMNDGVMSGLAMVSIDGVLYYVGETAIYRYDGYYNTPLSDKIDKMILNDPLESYFPMSGNRQLTWGAYFNRRVYFFYDSGGVGFTNVALVLDLNRGGWTVYQGLAFSSGAMLLAPEDPDPNPLVVGSASTGQLYDFEVLVGGSIPAAFQNASDDGAAIRVQAQTKFFKIGEPGTPKTLLRAQPELFTTSFNGQFSVTTDYGAIATLAVLVSVAIPGSTWGGSTWGGTIWNSPMLTFSKPRLDFNLQGEAFAFSIFTQDTNPPWRWVGLTGTYGQEGRN
jgi:hypothetical protein